MRVLAFSAMALVAGGTLFFLACGGDDTPATPDTTSSGNSSGSNGNNGSSNGNNGSSGDDIVVPDGGTLATNRECIIYCEPYQTAGNIRTVPRVVDAGEGTLTAVPWTNPEGALTAKDGELATVTLAEGQESEALEVTGFDFSAIADSKLTYGIKVELTRQSDDGGVEDAFIEVRIEDHQNEVRRKVLKGSWPRVQMGVHNYGQAEDTWGVNLEPFDVKKASFGARIAAKRRPGITSAPVLATVDGLRVSVCSCVKGDLGQNR